LYGTWHRPDPVLINAHTDKPDETAAYLNFLESDPGARPKGSAEVGMQPAPLELTRRPTSRRAPTPGRSAYTELQQGPATIGYHHLAFLPQAVTDTQLSRTSTKVFTGQLSRRTTWPA